MKNSNQIKQIGSYYQHNAIHKEPIEWIILDDNTYNEILISRYILACQPYHNEFIDTTWNESWLRYWLNYVFIKLAFSDREQECLDNFTCVPHNNSLFSTRQGYYSIDRVFILSEWEYNCYLKERGNCLATPYAIKDGCWINNEDNSSIYNDCALWWLRTMGGYNKRASFIGSFGRVNNYGWHIDNGGTGVRPCILLNKKKYMDIRFCY